MGPVIARCPVRGADLAVQQGKENRGRKASMNQRTRERLLALPHPLKTVRERLEAATR